MDYRKAYNTIKKQVTEEITAIARQYDVMHSMGMDGMTIQLPGVLGNYDLLEMWYDKEAGDVVFATDDGHEIYLDNYDLDTMIDILSFLRKNSDFVPEQGEGEYSTYQVFSEGENGTLTVDNVDTLKEATALYEEKQGFLLLGVYFPTCFNVIYARPYGMAVIS